MGSENKQKHPLWLTRILYKSTWFFFLLSWFLVYLYIVGNFQDFLDTTQLLLFELLRWISGLGAYTSASALFFTWIPQNLRNKAFLRTAQLLILLLIQLSIGFVVHFFQAILSFNAPGSQI